METRQKTILVTIGVVQAVGLLLTLILGGTELLFYSPVAAFGIINFWGGLLAVFIGLLTLIAPGMRVRAQGILGAGAIMMVLGFALCTQEM